MELVWRENAGWFWLLWGIFYFWGGYLLEKGRKMREGRWPYFWGALALAWGFWRLAQKGDLAGLFLAGQKVTSYQRWDRTVGWSFAGAGGVFLLLAWLARELKNKGWGEGGRYRYFFELLGVWWVLTGVFNLGVGGHKPFYEVLYLVTSLAFIFGSIPRSTKIFLYGGAMGLTVFIFSTGFEYFEDKVGWPAVLAVAGGASMAIGLGMEKLRRDYFAKRLDYGNGQGAGNEKGLQEKAKNLAFGVMVEKAAMNPVKGTEKGKAEEVGGSLKKIGENRDKGI